MDALLQKLCGITQECVRHGFASGSFGGSEGAFGAEKVTTPAKKAKASTITVSWRRNPRLVTMGPEVAAKSRAMRRWTAAGCRFIRTIVHDKNVIAGPPDAEVECAGLADLGYGQQTVGNIFAQTFEIGAGHESQANLFRSGRHVEGGNHKGGVLAQVDLDIFPLGGRNMVDLVHQFDAGGSGQQDEAGKQVHGTGR